MRVLRSVVALGLLAVALNACSRGEESSLPTPSKAFCQAAYDYDTNLPKLADKPRKQAALVQKLADHSPKDIADDTQVYLDAMNRAIDGDHSVVDNPKIEQAVDNVNRRAAAGCKLYEQNKEGNGGM